MQLKVTRRANSLGVRIPSIVAGRMGLAEGSLVDVKVENDRIVLAPARPQYRLEDLLCGMTRRAIHAAFDWDHKVGREAIEE